MYLAHILFMKHEIKLLTAVFSLCVLSNFPAYGQWNYKQDCRCVADAVAGTSEKNWPDTVFTFSPSSRIVLCGFKDTSYGELLYTEFIMAVCGCDYSIAYWNASQFCRLKFKKDTLFVENIKRLPVGPDRSYQNVSWSRELITFRFERVQRKLEVNKNIRRYSKEEIQQTLDEYKKAEPGKRQELMDKLFIAAISGSKSAAKYLRELKEKDGPLRKELVNIYDDLSDMLALWQRQNPVSKRGTLVKND
jgi:hypothetical protein